MLPRTRTRFVAHTLALSLMLAASACGKRYIEGTTPQQAMAYELNEGLTHLRSAQDAVIAAVDKNPEIKPTADKFLDPVYKALLLARDRIVPALEAYDAAVKIGDEARKLALASDLKTPNDQFNTLAGQAFGVSRPPEVTTSISGFVAEVQETLAILRKEFNLGGATPAPPQT